MLVFIGRLFDFEKSEEFKAYLRNVEAPPGDKGMLKVKAKWYKRVKVPSEISTEHPAVVLVNTAEQALTSHTSCMTWSVQLNPPYT